MVESLNDYERIATIKNWLKKYGKLTISISAVMLLAMAAWRYWHYYQHKQAELASLIYTQLSDDLASNNIASIEAATKELMQRYPTTPYAKLAALTLAQRAVKENQLDTAAIHLKWVIDHRQQAILSQLAKIRLARILVAQQKPQQALDILAGAEQIYSAKINAVRAQAWLALGQKDKARQELRCAITDLPSDAPTLPILKMQLNDI